jgi:hypothetical protein
LPAVGGCVPGGFVSACSIPKRPSGCRCHTVILTPPSSRTLCSGPTHCRHSYPQCVWFVSVFVCLCCAPVNHSATPLTRSEILPCYIGQYCVLGIMVSAAFCVGLTFSRDALCARRGKCCCVHQKQPNVSAINVDVRVGIVSLYMLFLPRRRVLPGASQAQTLPLCVTTALRALTPSFPAVRQMLCKKKTWALGGWCPESLAVGLWLLQGHRGASHVQQITPPGILHTAAGRKSCA